MKNLPGTLSGLKQSKHTIFVGLGLEQSCFGSNECLLIHSAILLNKMSQKFLSRHYPGTAWIFFLNKNKKL